MFFLSLISQVGLWITRTLDCQECLDLRVATVVSELLGGDSFASS